MVLPSCESISARRNEPGPLSFVFVTVMVVASAEIAIAQTKLMEMAIRCIIAGMARSYSASRKQTTQIRAKKKSLFIQPFAIDMRRNL